jgi:glutamine cyclotransferase
MRAVAKKAGARAPRKAPEPEREEASDAGEAPGTPPPSSRAQIGWVAAAVAIVIALVALSRVRQSDAGAEPGREIELDAPSGPPAAPERLSLRVVRSFPHDPDAFTQGLLWHDGHLLESTGQYGRSTVRRVDLESGAVLAQRELERSVFAEGLERVGDRLYQITWREEEAHVWSVGDLEHIETLEYEGEGWGLCLHGEHLAMSDGSDRIVFRDPATFRVVRTLHVRERGEPVDQINELECANGAIWANVWMTDRILRIDPASGRVTGTLDASGLLDEEERRGADVLNGIAWIPEREHFVLTGKLWPRAFEVEITGPEA